MFYDIVVRLLSCTVLRVDVTRKPDIFLRLLCCLKGNQWAVKVSALHFEFIVEEQESI